MQYALQYAASQAPAPVLGIRQGEAHPFIPRPSVPRTVEQCTLREYVVPEMREFRAADAGFPRVQSHQLHSHVCIS